ncbi:unnamed protein product [Caenorhabditis angaria]|uniref:Lipase n=1 Tax=Caenorhabditis angaria TaxID=860376 RepID=A0A9P1IU34_9PELO|nr:unnamed protein product [Caenorhabditis angaria]
MRHFELLLAFLFIIGGSTREIEEDLDTVDIISHYGYPVERHFVTTQDGYTNQVHRIPQGRDSRTIGGCSKRPVVFFMHGLFASSFEFVLNLPSQSPAYVFADAGFDVWLGNVRGTEYGRNHSHFSPKEQQFWNFSLYDHSHSDLRSQIEYVLKETGQENLFYVGHSQGTAVMFARLAEAEPAWQNKIRAFFAMGPTAGFIKPDLPFELLENHEIQRLIQFVLDGRFGIIPINIPKPIVSALADVCGQHFLTHFCASAFYLSAGREKLGQMNETRIPVFVSHFPSTTSTLNLLHWVQIFKYHEIRHLDLGPKRNLQIYGQTEAPALDIGRINVPTYLYYSHDDRVTDERDVNEIIIKRMGPALKEANNLDHFSHYDFAVGLRATDEVYKPIIYQIYKDIENDGC